MTKTQKLPPLRAKATLKGELTGGIIRDPLSTIDKDTKTAATKVRKEN